MARRAAYRKKRQNRFGMFLVSIAVIMMLVVVAFKSAELRAKKEAYHQKELYFSSRSRQKRNALQKQKNLKSIHRPRSISRKQQGINLDWCMMVRYCLRMKIKAGRFACFHYFFGKNQACIFCQKVFKIYFQILTNCPFVILYNIPLQEINVKN